MTGTVVSIPPMSNRPALFLLDAIQVLETATTPGTLVQLPYKWDDRDPMDSWEEEEMLHPSVM